MPATTPGGWPYVLPTDKPLEFPAHSQALATQLDTGLRTVWTPATGWASYEPDTTHLMITRMGGLVHVAGMVKRTGSSLPCSPGTYYTIGSVPTGYYPSKYAPWTGTADPTLGGTSSVLRGIIDSNSGQIAFTNSNATFTVNAWIALNFTYQAK